MALAPSGISHPGARPWPLAGLGRWSRRARWLLLAIASVLVLAALALRLADEPLRRTLERRVNAALTGYTATTVMRICGCSASSSAT
jgi:hypothetical protein